MAMFSDEDHKIDPADIRIRGRSCFVELLGSYPRVKILDFFLDNPGSPYAVSDVLTRVAVSRASAYNTINLFHRLGVLKSEGLADRSRLYTLNDNSSITVALKDLDFACCDAAADAACAAEG